MNELADPMIPSPADIAAEIVRLGDEVRRDLISLEEARRCAEALAALVSPVGVAEVEQYAHHELRAGNYRDAVVLADLLEHATRVSGDLAASRAAWWRAGMLLLTCAPQALAELPDGRIYRRSLDVARSLLAAASERQDRMSTGQVLLRMALLHVDSYTLGKTTVGYQQQRQFWADRMTRELGHRIAEYPDADLAMPPAADALREGLADAAAAAGLAARR